MGVPSRVAVARQHEVVRERAHLHGAAEVGALEGRVEEEGVG